METFYRQFSLAQGREQWLLKSTLHFLMLSAQQSAWASLCVVGVIGWLNQEVIQASAMAKLWLTYGVFIAFAGIVHAQFFHLRREWLGDEHWLLLYRIILFGGGLCYGSVSHVLLVHLPLAEQAILIMIIIGMPAAAMGALAFDRITYRGYLYAVGALTVGYFAFSNDENLQVFTVLVAIFVVILDLVSIRFTQAIQENMNLAFEMTQRAQFDPLVPLYNRAAIENQFDRQVLSSTNVNMILMDLDNFKPLNDKFGHHVGDKALLDVANMLKRAVGQQGLCARLGGDEFLILLFDAPLEEATFLAKNILTSIERLTVEHHSLEHFSASMGVIHYSAKPAAFSALVREADQLLYQSKRTGRAKITSQVFSQHC